MSSASDFPVIRASLPSDLPGIQAIYARQVEHGTGTFELDVPSVADMAARRDAVLASGWPWLVAEDSGEVLGYAYANQYRPRRAYRFCLEDSIYLAEQAQGRRIGTRLLSEVLRQCEALGARQILAMIGDSANLASIRLHQRLGFEQGGVLKSSGWKLGAWRDVVVMQRALGPGDTTTPQD